MSKLPEEAAMEKYEKRARERARNSDRKRELGDDIGEIVALKKRKWSRIAQGKGLCCQRGGFEEGTGSF